MSIDYLALKKFKRGPFEVTYSHRAKTSRMGRFGGGWQWEVGLQAGHLTRQRGTVIANLLVASVRIHWDRRAGVR